MTDDAASSLRESREIQIPAVLDLGQSEAARDALARMPNPVAIPVRVEWNSAPSTQAGPAAPVAPMTPKPNAQAPDRDTRETGGAATGWAPVASRPRRVSPRVEN